MTQYSYDIPHRDVHYEHEQIRNRTRLAYHLGELDRRSGVREPALNSLRQLVYAYLYSHGHELNGIAMEMTWNDRYLGKKITQEIGYLGKFPEAYFEDTDTSDGDRRRIVK